jgi:hypothetical protein
MTINEQQRLGLHNALASQIGGDMAGVLMSSLPPFDWSQVATKDDLRNLPTRDEMNMKFAELRGDFQKSMKATVFMLFGLNIALGSLIVGIATYFSR